MASLNKDNSRVTDILGSILSPDLRTGRGQQNLNSSSSITERAGRLNEFQGTLSFKQANHLLRRASFGPDPSIIQNFTGLTALEAVKQQYPHLLILLLENHG